MPLGASPYAVRRAPAGGATAHYLRLMRAKDLAEDYPMAHLDDDAYAAVMAMASQRRPGVVVLGEGEVPLLVLPGTQVLRFLVPRYVQDDPSLARVFDESDAIEACVSKLSGHAVRELLPSEGKRAELAVVDGDATVMECAALMVRLRSPLLVVADGDVIHGVITASHLVDRLLGGPAA